MTVTIQSKLRLRSAAVDDADVLFEWANDEKVRLNSFSPEKIVYADHKAWLARRIESRDSILLIAEDDSGQPVGQIRFDSSGPTRADIDFHVSNQHHGRGYGTQLLVEGFGWVVRDGRFRQVRGIVKVANVASKRCFEKAGFSNGGSVEHRGERCFLFTLETPPK
jgi:RimJ/RimL family protein N-acetyltransferase